MVTDGRPLIFDATVISAALPRLRDVREHLAAKRDHYRALADGLRSPHPAWGGHLGIAWSLVNWWAHDGFHRVTGLNYEGLIRIEYGFHVTLIVGGILAAYFFLSVARIASRATDRVHAKLALEGVR